jgi:hypothetical protein
MFKKFFFKSLYNLIKKPFAREIQESNYLKEISKKEVSLLKKIEVFDKKNDKEDIIKQFSNLSDEDKMVNIHFMLKRFNSVYDASIIEFINITLPNYFTTIEYLIAFPTVLAYYKSLGQSLPKEFIDNFEKVFAKKGIYLPFFVLRRFSIVYTFNLSKESQLHFDNYLIYALDNQFVKSRFHSPMVLIDILKEIGNQCSYECFYKIITFFNENYRDENLISMHVKLELFACINILTNQKQMNNLKHTALKNFLEATYDDTYTSLITTNLINRRLVIILLRLTNRFKIHIKNDKDITHAIIKSLLNNIHSYGIDICCVAIHQLGRQRRNHLGILKKDILRLIETISTNVKSFDNFKCLFTYLLMNYERDVQQGELLNFIFNRFVSKLIETNGTTIEEMDALNIVFAIRHIIKNKSLIKVDNFTLALLREYYEFVKPYYEKVAIDEEVESILPDIHDDIEDKLEESVLGEDKEIKI